MSLAVTMSIECKCGERVEVDSTIDIDSTADFAGNAWKHEILLHKRGFALPAGWSWVVVDSYGNIIEPPVVGPALSSVHGANEYWRCPLHRGWPSSAFEGKGQPRPWDVALELDLDRITEL